MQTKNIKIGDEVAVFNYGETYRCRVTDKVRGTGYDTNTYIRYLRLDPETGVPLDLPEVQVRGRDIRGLWEVYAVEAEAQRLAVMERQRGRDERRARIEAALAAMHLSDDVHVLVGHMDGPIWNYAQFSIEALEALAERYVGYETCCGKHFGELASPAAE